MKVLSLFDGISCGRLALERAGIPVERYVAYEIDENAIKVSKKNWDDIEYRGDVTTADFSAYKGFDLLIGGSPCQDLSIANKNREGLSGKRSILFWDFVRAIEQVQPKYFMFENNYRIPKIAQDIMTGALGVSPVVIDSSALSAQSRKRLYWTNIPLLSIDHKNICVADILDDIDVKENYYNIAKFNYKQLKNTNSPMKIGIIGNGGQGERIYDIKGKSPTLKSNGGGKGASGGLWLVDNVVRKLTPIEQERLQTLPDNYTDCLSSNQRRKVIGNGWTVDVIAHILSCIPEEDR